MILLLQPSKVLGYRLHHHALECTLSSGLMYARKDHAQLLDVGDRFFFAPRLLPDDFPPLAFVLLLDLGYFELQLLLLKAQQKHLKSKLLRLKREQRRD